MEYSLTNLYVYKNCVSLGYPVLESILSTIDICDEALFCVDPTSDEDTLKLVDKVCEKYPKARRLDFVWPDNAPGDGSKIGIATRYAYANATTTHVLNVQADEVYPPELSEWTAENWMRLSDMGYDGFRFKVLNTEHNVQFFQGDDPATRPANETRKSTWEWQIGAGYNVSEKLVKRCPAIKVAHDAWRFEGITMLYHVSMSDEYPILHCHDMFRDSLIALRRTAANSIWTQNPAYAATADGLESSREAWWDSPVWTNRTSPFDQVLHPLLREIIGDVKYHVRWELLEPNVSQ